MFNDLINETENNKNLNTNYSLELIDHQLNSTLGKELENEFNKFRIFPKVSETEFRNNKLADIVKKHTNLYITVELDTGYESYVFNPDINKNNPILDDWRRQYMQNLDSTQFLKNKDHIEGIVDLKHAKVFGDFTKILSTIHLGINLLGKYSPITVEEMTAVFLHEVGHVFTYFEMLGRLSRTNYVLSEGTKQLLNAKDKEQRIKIFNSIEDFTKTSIENKDAISNGSLNENGYRIIILDTIQKQAQQELNIDIYSTRLWEQLADNFAARFGYGRHLATMLDKLHRLDFSIEYINPYINTLYNIFSYVILNMVPFSTIILVLFFTRNNPLDLEYDPPKKRIEKFKHQINDILKNPKISKSQKQVYLQDYDEIQNILSKMYNNKSLLTFIYVYFTYSGSKENKLIKMQEELEKLQNNDLFTASTRIELLE